MRYSLHLAYISREKDFCSETEFNFKIRGNFLFQMSSPYQFHQASLPLESCYQPSQARGLLFRNRCFIHGCAYGPYHSSYSGEPVVIWSDSVNRDLYILDESEFEKPYEIEKHKEMCKIVDGSTPRMQRPEKIATRQLFFTFWLSPYLEYLLKLVRP